MINEPLYQLQHIKRNYDFFIGIDSDGCVFDTMELKQKEVFIPVTIKTWKLQRFARIVREIQEFVNLYSIYRGTNRFLALIQTFAYLKDRLTVQNIQHEIPDLSPLIHWTQEADQLGNAKLEGYLSTNYHPILEQALHWSEEINAIIQEMVTDIPPFPYVLEALDMIHNKADIMVISQTPTEALIREWTEHTIHSFPNLIAGQEYGTKKLQLHYAIGSFYDKKHVLMIGDSPGDLIAAKENGVLFYPIIPGKEELSWKQLIEEGLHRFFTTSYHGVYEQKCIETFNQTLPTIPPWDNSIVR